jgi:uncharacterized membrane protein YkoI
MKRSLRSLLFAIFMALGLFVGYGLTQQSLAQQTQNDNDSETNDDQEANDDEDGSSDGETNDDEMNDDEASLETSESEETEGVEANQSPSAIESFGSVSLTDAIKIAQTELASSTPPFEATFEKVNGQLVWMLDFVSPAKQISVSAESGEVVGSGDLTQVPTPDAALTDYGSLDLDKVVEIAQTAYGSPADVTEMALEKDNGTLTWRVDIADNLVVIDADTGAILSKGALN